MTITKNTKIIIGVALLGVAGYIYFKSKKDDKATTPTAADKCKKDDTQCLSKCVAPKVNREYNNGNASNPNPDGLMVCANPGE